MGHTSVNRCNCYFPPNRAKITSSLSSKLFHVFEKMKKKPGDIIILHKCAQNYDQMMYGSWDMVHDECIFFSFWAIFCPFTPLTAWKIKILKKWKKAWRYHHFICVRKIMIRWCTVSEIWCVTDVIIISHFGHFLPFYPPNSQKTQNFEKNNKKRQEISFYICVPKIMIRWCTVSEIWCVTDDGEMDGKSEI